jgi:hypothetical protein
VYVCTSRAAIHFQFFFAISVCDEMPKIWFFAVSAVRRRQMNIDIGSWLNYVAVNRRFYPKADDR